MVKNLPSMQETWVRSLGWEDPLEKGMAIHSSILAWKIPWNHKELDMTERLTLTFFSLSYIFLKRSILIFNSSLLVMS